MVFGALNCVAGTPEDIQNWNMYSPPCVSEVLHSNPALEKLFHGQDFLFS